MPIFPHTALVRVRRIDGERAHSVRDNVAVEDPLEIQVAQERNSLRTIRSVSVTMRTPGNDAELATGFLFGEGLLNQIPTLQRSNSLRRRQTACEFDCVADCSWI